MPRQGPGLPGDVLWALSVLGCSGRLRVCDAGAGPGADTETLAAALPEARITAVEISAPLAAEARARLAPYAPRVEVVEADMAALAGPCDLIWSAGALYFLGVAEGLRAWRDALAPGGAVAFSEPVLLPGPETEAEREAVARFWTEYPGLTDLAGIAARVAQAGFAMVAHRLIVGEAWRLYYQAMAARCDELEAGAAKGDPALAAVVTAAREEIGLWQSAPDRIAYALILARPVTDGNGQGRATGE